MKSEMGTAFALMLDGSQVGVFQYEGTDWPAMYGQLDIGECPAEARLLFEDFFGAVEENDRVRLAAPQEQLFLMNFRLRSEELGIEYSGVWFGGERDCVRIRCLEQTRLQQRQPDSDG